MDVWGWTWPDPRPEQDRCDPGTPWKRGPGRRADTQAGTTVPRTPLSAALPSPRRLHQLLGFPPLFHQPIWVGEAPMWLLGAEDGGVTPAESHPREASEEPRWWLPPPATICRLAPGPEELVGRWGSGSDQPQPLLAPPIWATNAPRWPPWPCLLQPSPGAPRFPWTLRCLQGPLGQDLRWAAPLLPTHRTLGQGSGTALPPR